MGYKNLRSCVQDLERTGQLVRIESEVDPHLEAAAIHRRVFQAGGPAVYYARLKGCSFPAVSNLFGTLTRTEFLFRDILASAKRLMELATDPSLWKKELLLNTRALFAAPFMLPRRAWSAPVTQNDCSISQLPQITCWPRDGGPFVTLPQVYTEDPRRPGRSSSNLGMYRIQLSGNQYAADREVGLHYQIHRGIGVHHSAAIVRGERLPVVVSVGGPPSLAVAAVMPLPEGMSELGFAGLLGGRRLSLTKAPHGLVVPAEADFAIFGTVDPRRLLPEGPFGDHLGYYAKTHDFPVLDVERVVHRRDAIWPFTVVGRPPQEDTSFGKLIHELTGPVLPKVIKGLRAIHAVDAAGVHPLLLAIGSERYVPYESPRRPRELLTCAHSILGQGQLSLAKYLFICAGEDNPNLDIHDIPAFLRHLLERLDPARDLHFQTSTTIDTLDYSGTGLNEGSKLVIAVAGPRRRDLPTTILPDLVLPDGFSHPHLCLPGVIAVKSPPFQDEKKEVETAVERLVHSFAPSDPVNAYPLVVLVDDSDFAAHSVNNFLWATFTRSNPAADVHGIGAFHYQKHFGCTGSLVIDARSKPHHAPVLEEDPVVEKTVDNLGAAGGPLHGIV